MDVDADVDLFGENDEDVDHFFLPEHYGIGDEATADDGGADDAFQLPQADARHEAHDNEFAGIGEHFANAQRDDDDDLSLQSSGLGDEDLPEEEEATGEREDFDYEDLIRQAQTNVERGDDAGPEISLPDFGGIPPTAAGAMARWMDGVEQATRGGEQQGGAAIPPVPALGGAFVREEVLKEFYPSFEPGARLRLTDLFASRHKPWKATVRRPPKPCVPTKLTLEPEIDGEKLFMHRSKRVKLAGGDDSQRAGIRSTADVASRSWTVLYGSKYADDGAIEVDSSDAEIVSDLDSTDGDLILACDSWDERIYSPDGLAESSDKPVLRYNQDVDQRAMLRLGDLTNGTAQSSAAKIDLNDRHLLVRPDARPAEEARPATKPSLFGRFSWSNDEAYRMLSKAGQALVRSGHSQLEIVHAGFAERLQSPFYKTQLTKSEQRAIHRPNMIFKPNQELRFSRLRKRQKTKVKDPRIVFAHSKDMSLADSSGFALFEYSEEYPAVLSNVGMGSKIINYYRKRDAADEYRPTGGFGEAQILAPDDSSPFWNFGHVEPGETTPTMYNRMSRAPVFKQSAEPTDFLLLRDRTRSGGERCYLRLIRNLFVVGQLFPVVEIPGPHSRRVTTAAKNRLKMVAYRIMRRNDLGRIIVKQLVKHFPEQNEGQLRQRLKDFMEYSRVKGEEMGYWRLKEGDILPSEEGTRSMVDPETVCLVDAMQAGLRQLEDAGYGKSAAADDDKDENLDAEQQLAPWLASRNFLNATQGKAMLQLHGDGDPTGRGEGFSFLKTSMKGGFRSTGESLDDKLEREKSAKARSGHSYSVANQQRAYEEEINRIWNAQKSTLSMSGRQVLDREALEDIDNGDGASDAAYGGDSGSVAQTPGASTADDDASSVQSGASNAGANKVMRITRVIRDESGHQKTTSELITNPHVIHAYIKKRQQMNEAALADDFVHGTPEEIAARQKKKLEEELARLKRNQERRQARKAAALRKSLKSQGHLAHASGVSSPMTPGSSGLTAAPSPAPEQ